MNCEYIKVGSREFLRIGKDMIPVDRIKQIDLEASSGGCVNSVQIFTDDPEDHFFWVYSEADSLREFLTNKA